MNEVEGTAVVQSRESHFSFSTIRIHAKSFLTFIILSIILPLLVIAQTPEDIYQEAIDLFQNSQYQEAFEKFNSFLTSVNEDHPLTDNAQYYSGECYYNINYETKRFDQAMEKFRLVRSRYSDSDVVDKATYKLAWCSFWLGSANDLRNANSLFLEVTRQFLESDLVLPAYYMAALSLYRLGEATTDVQDYETASDAFKRIIDSDAFQGERLNVSAHCVFADTYIKMAKLHQIKAVDTEALIGAQEEYSIADSLFDLALQTYSDARTILDDFRTDKEFHDDYSKYITYSEGLCHLHMAFSDRSAYFEQAQERFDALGDDVFYSHSSRYRLADVAFGQADLEKAENLYDAIVTEYRTDIISEYAKYWLAWAHFLKGDRLWREGTDLMVRGRITQARQSYQQARRKYDQAREMYSTLVGQYRTSSEEKLRALTEDVQFRVGECYYRTEDYQLALDTFNKVGMVPQALSDRLELRRLGCKRMLGDPWRQDFDRYLGMWSDTRLIGVGQYFLGEGVIAAQREDRDNAFNSARTVLQKVSERFPSSELMNLSRFLTAVSYHKERDFPNARRWYDLCAGEYKDEGGYAKGIAYFDAEDYDAAITIFQPLVNRGHYRAAYQMANCYFNQHKWPEAIRLYLKIINTFSVDPEHPWRKKAEKSRQNAYSNYPQGRSIVVTENLGENLAVIPFITYESLQEEIFERALEKEAKHLWIKHTLNKIDLYIPINDREYAIGVVGLLVRTRPEGVEIYIDGEYKKSTPFDGPLEVRSGMHKIRLEKRNECYTWEKELPLFQSIELIDVSMAEMVTYDQEVGILEGNFRYPVDMVKDGEGFLYVADAGSGVVKKFRSDGKFDKEIGKGDLVFPTGVAIANDKLIIIDSRSNMVKRSNLDGSELEIFLIEGRDWGKFNRPTDVAVSGDNLYVVDSGHHRILCFHTETGKYKKIVKGPGWLNSPEGIAVDERTGDIFVAECGNRRITRIDKNGVIIRSFGEISKPNELWYPTRLDIEYVTVVDDEYTFLFIVYDHEPKTLQDRNVIKKFNSEGNELQTINESLLSYSIFIDGSDKEAILYILEKELVRDHIKIIGSR